MAEQQIVKSGSGQVKMREEKLAQEITVGRDTSAEAAAAAAKAEVEVRTAQALKFPRNLDQFREDILRDCKRPGFAEIALYRKPVGRKKNQETGKWEENFAVGESVRFIESALQAFGNVHVFSRIDYENSEQAKLTVGVLDLQRNVGYSFDVILDKLIERREVKTGRKPRGMRENSYGDMVYLVEATKDEFRNIMGAERSKLLRDNGRRLLPRDILDECRAQIEATLADANAKDPDAQRKKMLDAFSALGVSATMLQEYLGRPFESLQPADINDLRALHNALKDGECTWADVMRAKAEPAEGEPKRTSARERILEQPSFAPPDAKPEEQQS